MTRIVLHRLALAAVMGGLVLVAHHIVGSRKTLADLTPAQRERLSGKAADLSRRRFGEPDLAQAFYVNSRTGPIITRGPNPTTGVRTLSPDRYFPALRQMLDMTRYSTAEGSVLPSAASMGEPFAATPGNAIGTWTSLGPGNQGGRTRGLLVDPGNPNVMYAGGVAGGVWKSTDAGANWTATSDLMANLAVVTLAFDPSNSSVIYAGTGEGFFNGDAVRGAGIFKSTDAGANWTRLASTNAQTFHYTMKILVSPRNTQRVWAATRMGLFRSLDAGVSWSMVLNAFPVNGCTDMAMQVAGGSGYVFASCGAGGGQGTVYRAADTDAGTFASILDLGTSQGRSSIAVAPSNETIVYVMTAQNTAGAGPGRNGLHGIYRSTTSGDSFTTQRQGNVAPVSTAQKINQLLLSNPVIALLSECNFGTSSFSNQGWYDNVLAVDPLDPNVVWAGGIDLWRSDNGGIDWGAAGYWWFDRGVDPQYHHADQHAIVFHPQYNGTSNRVMFSGSDGGVERIDNARAPVNTTLDQLCGNPVAGSPSWIDRNNGYVTTQFFDGVSYPDGQTYFGGLQDNGTMRGTSAGSNWSVLLGGDGGYAAVDTLGDGNAANDVLFAENTRNSLKKSTNGGASFAAANAGITGNPNGFLFIAPFAMNQGNRQQLWIGGREIWRTVNQAGTWTQASLSTCGNGSISAIATHPLDGNRVLVGMSDGCYQYNTAALSAPGTINWPSGSITSGSVISWMAWDPNNVNVAYATVSNFDVTNLLKTTNGGVSWSPSVGTGLTALPQIPALSVVVNPADSQQVFVGTDLGVFTSVDGGASWYVENTGFANVPVESLKFNETPPYRLYAFTHGRGAWRVSLNESPTLSINDVSVFEGDAGTTNVVFTATLSASSTQTVTVSAVTSNGTAIAPGDYATTGPQTLTFAPGETTKPFTVLVNGDVQAEGDETFTVTLSNSANATIADGVGVGTILNDDGITLSDAAASEGYVSTGVMRFLVSRAATATGPGTVDYVTSNGSATAGLDYVFAQGTLTFANGERRKFIEVTINGDKVEEPNETFTLTLSNPNGFTIARGVATGTILNDDEATLRVTDAKSWDWTGAKFGEGTNAGQSDLRFNIWTSKVLSDRDIYVDYTTVNGTAASGSDFTAVSGTVMIARGTAVQQVIVPVNRDPNVEPDETMIFRLSNAINASIYKSDGLGTVVADDGLVVSIGDKSVTEGNAGTSPMVFTATLNQASGDPVTVNWSTVEGSAIAPDDFVAANGQITFPANQTTQTITVQVVGDAVSEPYETFSVVLSSPGGGAILGDAEGTGTIVNTDGISDRFRLMFHNLADNHLYRWHFKKELAGSPSLETFNWVTPWGPDPAWNIGAIADFDRDGNLDYLWHNYTTGQILFWYIDGDNLKGFKFGNYTMASPWRAVTTMDANGDGELDVVYYNDQTGALKVVLCENGNRRTGPGSEYDVTTLVTGSWRVASASDVNGDGGDDLILYNSSTGGIEAWQLTGPTRTATLAYAAVQTPNPAQFRLVSARADFNADGKPDFLWHNTTTGFFMTWSMDGTTRLGIGAFASPFDRTDPTWRLVGAATLWP